MEILDFLTSFEKKKISAAVEYELEQYRIVKSVQILEGESQYFNQETVDKMKVFCNRVDGAVNELPGAEKQLITKKYLSNECDYITDYVMYRQLMDPPISAGTYAMYRDRAKIKLALFLRIDTGVPKLNEIVS